MDGKDQKLYTEQLKHLKKNRDEAENRSNDLFVKHIDHLRKFHLHFITMSLIVLGAVIPFLSSENQTIFKTKILTFFGTGFIFVLLIFVVLYLTHILISENKRLTAKKDFYLESFGDEINKIDNSFRGDIPFKEYYKDYRERGEGYLREEKALNKTPWIIERIDIVGWVLSIMFLLGVLLIGLSCFKIDLTC